MLKRPLIATALAGGATALAVLGSGGAAYAANNTVTVWNSHGIPAGNVEHIDANDFFRVDDLYADGHGTRATLFDSDGDVLDTAYNGKGANGGPVYFDYNVLNGRTYYLNVCLVDGADDTVGRCNQETLYE